MKLQSLLMLYLKTDNFLDMFSKQYEFILDICHHHANNVCGHKKYTKWTFSFKPKQGGKHFFVSTHYTDSILVEMQAPSLLKHQLHQNKWSIKMRS